MPGTEEKKKTGMAMEEIIKENEISEIVKIVLDDYKGGKNIDVMNLYNNPSKAEVTELVKNLFRLVYPGYYKDKSYKIYNPDNSLAVTLLLIFVN